MNVGTIVNHDLFGKGVIREILRRVGSYITTEGELIIALGPGIEVCEVKFGGDIGTKEILSIYLREV